MPELTGRALTAEQKRTVIERLLAAWERMPEQRLAQFILNAAQVALPNVPLFYVEDEQLAAAVEGLVEECGR